MYEYIYKYTHNIYIKVYIRNIVTKPAKCKDTYCLYKE